MITRGEFAEWRRNPVTRALFEFIDEQVEQAKEGLAMDAGLNPLADRDLVGGIAAFRDVLEWQPEMEQESE